MKFNKIGDLDILRESLSGNLLINAPAIHALFESGMDFDCYADAGRRAILGLKRDHSNVIFAGNWDGLGLPVELLPDEFFTSACPPAAYELLQSKLTIKEEWPSWYYLAPESYGPGPWDDLGELTVDDVAFISQYWELGDDPEAHIRESVEKFNSACVRVDAKPVSWAGLHYEIGEYANLGFAHTLDEYRRRGLATIVTKSLINRLAKRGVRATSHVIKDNVNSVALCKSLGFERVGEATWAFVGAPPKE